MGIEDEAKKFIKEKETKTIGTAKGFEKRLENTEPAASLGYKAVDVKELPSRGYFYNDGTKIAIRPARIAEIKHWSTIEESDPISVDTALNFIMERCVRMTQKGGIASFKDLKEIDRLFLLFAVRELTFSTGQNKLNAEYYEDDKLKTIELRKEMISYFNMPEEFSEFYNNERKCFTFINPEDHNETCDIYFPSIGVSKTVDGWVNHLKAKRRNVEEEFVTNVQFLVKDFRTLTHERLNELRIESGNWSLWKISLLSYVTSQIMNLIDPTMTIKKSNGEEDVLPLNFQGGLKAIFLIPNPLGRPTRN